MLYHTILSHNIYFISFLQRNDWRRTVQLLTLHAHQKHQKEILTYQVDHKEQHLTYVYANLYIKINITLHLDSTSSKFFMLIYLYLLLCYRLIQKCTHLLLFFFIFNLLTFFQTSEILNYNQIYIMFLGCFFYWVSIGYGG